MSLDHHRALCDIGLDEDIWRWSPKPVETKDDMRAYIDEALDGKNRGLCFPFATVEKTSGVVVGSTRYGNIDLENRHVEIGWTWITRAWQRTAINTEAKFLMLGYAFEKLACLRVEFKTDSLNERSRNAILRLGAKEEGTFRNHMVTSSGRIRHSVYYSIIDSEWPDVKSNLEKRLVPNKQAS